MTIIFQVLVDDRPSLRIKVLLNTFSKMPTGYDVFFYHFLAKLQLLIISFCFNFYLTTFRLALFATEMELKIFEPIR